MTLPTPPEKKPDRHYDFRSTNVVFALSSLALLAVTLFMVMADFGRPWKRVQWRSSTPAEVPRFLR